MSSGLTYAEEGGTLDAPTDVALAANGATPFAKDVINGGGYPAHQTSHLNDGLYSNDYSWIGDSDPSWAVISFGAASKTIASFAYGRANQLPQFNDRFGGTTTFQYTTVANPDASTPDASWTTIGTVALTATTHPGFTNPILRHRYNINTPVTATGFRMITPGGNCIDEIELYSTAGTVSVPPPPPPPQAIDITAAAGFTIAWDGKNGSYADLPVPGLPENIALKPGAAAFASSLINGGGYPAHQIPHINDGLYGNDHSWIGASANSSAGVALGGLSNIIAVAWGRDNTGAGLTDRWVSQYTIQRTTVAGTPDALAALTDTGDPATGWAGIGTVTCNFNGTVGGNPFTGHLRHQFSLATTGGGPVQATALRLVCSADGACIDELEIYETLPPPPPPPPAPLVTTAEAGYVVTWDGNDGDQYGLSVPDNLALAAHGGMPIASGQLAPELGVDFPYHRIVNLNDGMYGNEHSWIGGGADAAPWFAGVLLPAPTTITSIAFGRDNLPDRPGFTPPFFTDRWAGTYTIQITADGTSWTPIGTVFLKGNGGVDALPGGGFTGPLRHEIKIAKTTGPIEAMGVRLLVPGTGIGGEGTAIDELEIYGTTTTPTPFDFTNFTTGPGDAFSLTFTSVAGVSYTVQYSENLADWASVTPALTGTAGTTTFSSHLNTTSLPALSGPNPRKLYFRVRR